MNPFDVRPIHHALRALALALICLAGIAPASAIAAPGWVPSTNISAIGGNPDDTRVAVDAAGDAVAVWWAEESGKSVVKAATRPAGGDWQPPVTISSSTTSALQPKIAISPAGAAVAAWRAVEGGNAEFVQVAEMSVGGAWSAPQTISPTVNTQIIEEPEVSVGAGGDAVVVWKGREGAVNVIQAASRAAGGAWTPAPTAPARISPADNRDAKEPHVSVDAAGNAVAIWLGNDKNFKNVIQGAVKPAGGSWQTATAISPELPTPWAEPKLDGNSKGDAVVVWNGEEGGQEVIQAASLSAGGSWQPPPSTPETISPTSDEDAVTPGVAIGENGEAVAFWSNNDENFELDVEVASRPAGGSWSAPSTISTERVWVWPEPQAVVGPNGRAMVVWAAEEEERKKAVIQASVRAADGSWPLGTKISSADAQSDEVQIALNESGDGVAVWRDSFSSGRAIAAALFDSTAPLLDAVSIPATGTAGSPLAFSASARDLFTGRVALSWSFGDGATAAGGGATHAFAAAGSYVVTVTATDPAGNSASASGTVSVAAPPKPKPKHGLATPARRATVRAGKALIALRCGTSPCAGTVVLKAKAKTIGKATFKIPAGASRTVKVKLNAKGAKLVAAAGKTGLKVKVSGSGIKAGTVLLKAAR